MITRYMHCPDCTEMHSLSEWPHNHRMPGTAFLDGRSKTLPLPSLNRDQMDALWHPSTGEIVDSKSEFRAITRKVGGTEMGNDAQTDNRKWDRVTKADVAEAMNMVSQGYKPEVEATTAGEGWSE